MLPRRRGELRAISTRAEITATNFTNEYNWGDLKSSPPRLVEQYFDAHFYLANWGSRTLMFRFPEQIVSTQVLAPYNIDEAVDVWSRGMHTVVAFHMSDDDYYEDDWWEHENALGDLIELCDHVMRGDLRSVNLVNSKELLMAENRDEVTSVQCADRCVVSLARARRTVHPGAAIVRDGSSCSETP